MQNILIGSSKTDVYKNVSIKGLSACFHINGVTNNVGATGNPLTLVQMQVSVNLIRNKVNVPIFNGNLRDLVAGTNYGKQGFKAFATDIMTFAKPVLVAGVSNKEQFVVPFTIPFDAVINLKGDDRLEYMLAFTTGSGNTTYVDATSFVTIDCIQGVGLEYGTPRFSVDPIAVSSSSYSNTLNENASRIVYLNFDKLSYLSANSTLTNINLNSDKFASNLNTDQITALNQSNGGLLTTNYEPFQSTEIYSGLALSNVQLSCVFNSSNITANQNVIFVKYYDTSKWLLDRANMASAKHDIENRSLFQ